MIICGFKQLLHTFARNLPLGRFRPIFYKMIGIKIGQNVIIEGNVWIDEVAPEKITIEEDVVIAPGVIIVAHEGASKCLRGLGYPFIKKEVLIKRGSWICSGAIILPGVCIGEGCIIGAGSVVLHDVPNYTMAAGVPARFIKNLQKSK